MIFFERTHRGTSLLTPTTGLVYAGAVRGDAATKSLQTRKARSVAWYPVGTCSYLAADRPRSNGVTLSLCGPGALSAVRTCCVLHYPPTQKGNCGAPKRRTDARAYPVGRDEWAAPPIAPGSQPGGISIITGRGRSRVSALRCGGAGVGITVVVVINII